MQHGHEGTEQACADSGFLLPADIVSEIYGVLQACADHYAKDGLSDPAEHARYLAFQLLNAPYV